jgi:hypoxanthine phosphoribosyltransferase
MVRIQDLTFEEYISEERIFARTSQLAKKINVDFEGKNPIFLGILNGSFMFLSELFKQITIECEVSFLKVSSYENQSSTGKVRELIGLNKSIDNRPVIIVEDIVDTGHTLAFIKDKISSFSPSKVSVMTLLHKVAATKIPHELDYVGFEIDNIFVVGFGLDYNELGRNHRCILAKS